MEDRQARHIGDIIRERYNRAADAAQGPQLDFISRAQKMLRLLLGPVLDALATIGWFVTLPFITHEGRALTSREQSRG